MKLLALVAVVAVAACRPAPRATTPPSNTASAAAPTWAWADPPSLEPQAVRRAAIGPELRGDLALVRSYEGLHDAVSRDALDAAERAFAGIKWRGMSSAHVAALLGAPTEREGEARWRYNLDHMHSSVFLTLRFKNGAVEQVIYGGGELTFGPPPIL